MSEAYAYIYNNVQNFDNFDMEQDEVREAMENGEKTAQFIENMCEIYDMDAHDLVPKDVCCHACVENYPKDELLKVLSVLYGLHEHIAYHSNDVNTRKYHQNMMDDYDKMVVHIEECDNYTETMAQMRLY